MDITITQEAINLAAQECHAWVSEGTERWEELDDDRRDYFRRMGSCVLHRAVNRKAPVNA